MAIPIGAAISTGSQLLGLFSGKNKGKAGDSTSRAISELFRSTIGLVEQDNPLERIRAAFTASREFTSTDAERVLGNVMSKFGQEGNLPGLPDTGKNSILRGALGDVFRDVTLAQAQAEAGAFEQMIANRTGLLSLGTAGRGRGRQPGTPFDTGAFGRGLGDLLKGAGVKF